MTRKLILIKHLYTIPIVSVLREWVVVVYRQLIIFSARTRCKCDEMIYGEDNVRIWRGYEEDIRFVLDQHA
jgi:hypothetical protein